MILDLSQPQHTPAGRFLGRLWYDYRPMDKLLTREQYSGYPHNGGEHTFYMKGDTSDIEAFLDIVEDQYGSVEGCKEFIEIGRKKFLDIKTKSYDHLY